MLANLAPRVDWSTFGEDRPPGWLATFDGHMLTITGQSAFGLDSVAETPHWSVYFDGLLYNHAELKEQVPGRDEPESLSNAELIGRLFEMRGRDVAQQLEGVFSFLIWDKTTDTLLAVRDRIGIFPLFYASRSGTYYLSTSLDRLASLPEANAGLNRSLLVSWIAFVWPVLDETAYDGIRRVRNGHQLVVHNETARTEQYWDMLGRVEDAGWVGEDEIERFGELLEKSIGRYLDLGDSAIYLSGGLDSVSVAAFAADESRRRGAPSPLALSIAFPEDEVNETAVQRSVAAQLALPQQLLPLETLVGPKGVIRESLDLCSSFPAPSTNLWRPAYARLGSMAVAEDRRVLLTGGGGDEWLGVTPMYAANLIQKGDIAGLYSLLAAYHRSFSLSLFGASRNVLWRFGLRPLMGDYAAKGISRVAPDWLRERQMRHWRAKFPSWLAIDPELQRAIDERLTIQLDDAHQRRWSTSPYLRELTEGLDHIVVSMDHESMYDEGRRLGAPILSPFQDAEMIEFLARTPPELLNAGGRAKGLVRGTLAKRFPALGFERQKKVGIGNYFEATLFPETYQVWKEMGGAAALGELGIVDRLEVDRAIDVLQRGDVSVVQKWQMLYLLYVESWVRYHLSERH